MFALLKRNVPGCNSVQVQQSPHDSCFLHQMYADDGMVAKFEINFIKLLSDLFSGLTLLHIKWVLMWNNKFGRWPHSRVKLEARGSAEGTGRRKSCFENTKEDHLRPYICPPCCRQVVIRVHVLLSAKTKHPAVQSRFAGAIMMVKTLKFVYAALAKHESEDRKATISSLSTRKRGERKNPSCIGFPAVPVMSSGVI